MRKDEQFDVITDLLVTFDELGFAPTILHPEPEKCAIEWKQNLVNALERLHKQSEGEWVKDAPHCNFHCSQCGFYPFTEYSKHLNFCPNCGAKMRKEDEGK